MTSDWNEVDEEEADIVSGLSAILGPRGLRVPPGIIERQVNELFERLAPADAENFLNSLKDVGRNIQKAASSKEFKGIVGTAAPIAGGAIGTYFGGPVGMQVGAQLGSVAGQAVTGGGMSGAFPAHNLASAPVGISPGTHAGANQGAAGAAPSLGGVTAGIGIAPPVGDVAAGSSAAAQLLSVIRNPAFVASLLSLAMGANGAPTVPVGTLGTAVPVGAMMNLTRTLINRATEDAEEILLSTRDGAPDYLLDAEGCLSCDPAIASQRADALMRLLNAHAEHVASEVDVDDLYDLYDQDDHGDHDGDEAADGVDHWEAEWAGSGWSDVD